MNPAATSLSIPTTDRKGPLPTGGFPAAVEQLRFAFQEMSAEKSGWRGWLNAGANCFRGGRLTVAAYRCKRCWWLLLGRWHGLSFLLMWPFYCWCRQLGGRHEIHLRAKIGPGFRMIHCSLPCVVSPYLIAGKNLYLTGGNVIGRRRVNLQAGAILLGDDVVLGINSMVIGPLQIGAGVRIGAGATVVKNVSAGETVVGSPVRHLSARSNHFPS